MVFYELKKKTQQSWAQNLRFGTISIMHQDLGISIK